MTINLDKLASLIGHNREALLSRWRQQVRALPSAEKLDNPTLNDHIPQLLGELAAALHSGSEETIPEALSQGTPPEHGRDRLRNAFDIEEVVAEYNILRACIHDLADEHGLTLQGKPFHVINRVFDQAIGLAVQSFATQRALEVQARREEYLSFVAHDLRTPLSAISLAGRVLEVTIASPEGDAGRMLKSLRRNVKRLEVLVTKVMDENLNLQTETGISLERREFDMWPLVESLVHDLHPVAGTGSTRLTNSVPEDTVVYADANLVKRIFQNLIANAIHYTERGQVDIGAVAAGEDGAVDCWVRDNGSGIPKDLLARIFDKGETDHRTEGARGLGLAIVKAFVEAHGGEVRVESEEGKGATFWFSLPARPAPGAA